MGLIAFALTILVAASPTPLCLSPAQEHLLAPPKRLQCWQLVHRSHCSLTIHWLVLPPLDGMGPGLDWWSLSTGSNGLPLGWKVPYGIFCNKSVVCLAGFDHQLSQCDNHRKNPILLFAVDNRDGRLALFRLARVENAQE